METLKVNILNPKAIKLLNNLAELNLISIQDNSDNRFAEVLNKMRSRAKTSPSSDEITKEVELVRSARYAK